MELQKMMEHVIVILDMLVQIVNIVILLHVMGVELHKMTEHVIVILDIPVQIVNTIIILHVMEEELQITTVHVLVILVFLMEHIVVSDIYKFKNIKVNIQ